jgi:hypothetical protein
MTSKTSLRDVTVRSFAYTDVSKQPDAFMTTLTMEMNEPMYRTHTASHYKDNINLHIHRRQNFVPDIHAKTFSSANTSNSFNFSRF